MWRTQTHDPRPPILFSRRFQDDQLYFKRPWWDLIGHWFDLWSYRKHIDEAMIDEIAQYGPVVALGMPGQKRISFGAMRYYSSHEDWQNIVTATAKQAQVIVIGVGSTAGVIWEYELLAREHLLDRTILLFPPTAGDTTANLLAINTFEKATNTHIPIDSSQMTNQPVALLPTDVGITLLTSNKPVAAAYLVAIRAFFQKCTAKQLSDPLQF